MTVRIAVLASGRGSNLQALIDHFSAVAEQASGAIELVASNRDTAPALERAHAASIATEIFNADDDGSALIGILRKHDIGLVVLAGYMKRIPPSVVREYQSRTVNVHPGLLPEFGGHGMYGRRVHEAVLKSGSTTSGVTVHLVDDEFDHGPVLAQWRVPVEADDTPESLAARVLAVEHLIYPRAVEMMAALIGRKFVADL